jgi:hypothetical protein
MATGPKGGTFEYYGSQYRETFARSNIELELRETAGSAENLELLLDPETGVQIAQMTGGISDGKHAPVLPICRSTCLCGYPSMYKERLQCW